MSDPKGETTQYTIPVPNKSERDNESVISHKEKQPYQISTAQSIQRHPLSDQIERQINQSIIQNKSIVQIDHLNQSSNLAVSSQEPRPALQPAGASASFGTPKSKRKQHMRCL